MGLCPSVCPSARPSQVGVLPKTAKRRITQTTPRDSPGTSGGFRGVRGCGRTPLGVLQKNSWSTNFENSEDSGQHDYYYYQFYLAASSHEIFLRVGGREGMKGLGALQRHQLPHPPCKNPGSAPARNSSFLMPKIFRGHQMQVGWVKIGDFPQITGYISKTVQDRRMVSIKVE